MKKLSHIAVAFCLCAVSWTAMAHDVWLTADGGHWKLIYGHPGELEPYEPAKLKKVTAVNKQGKAVAVEQSVIDNHVHVRPASEIAMVALDYDNGFWTSNLSDGWRNVSKSKVPDYRQSSHSKKFGKNLMQWSDALKSPVGMEMEMVPLADPMGAGKGDDVRFQVLYQGKPLSGARVEVYGTKDEYMTDSEGMVTLPLPHSGFQYVAAHHEIPLKDNPDADKLSLTANVVFNSR